MLKWQISKSGRHSVHSVAIESPQQDALQNHLVEFWTYIHESLKSVPEIAWIRGEIWLDSGRLICFAVDKHGTVRAGDVTIQAILPAIKEEWDRLSETDITDSEFEDACVSMRMGLARVAMVAKARSPLPLSAHMFDADGVEDILVG